MKEERYNQIIDEAYENYRNKRTTANKDNVREPHTLRNGMTGEISRPFTKEEFVDKCKADSDFSGRWGVNIDDIKLSLSESTEIVNNNKFILELTTEESKNLLNCLMRTYANGKDLDVGIMIEDKISEFLKKNKDE